MYKLSGRPFILNHIMYPFVFWDEFLPEEIIQKTIEYCDKNGTEKSSIVNNGGQEVEALHIRKSEVKMHFHDENTSFVFDRFLDIATHINDNFFNFDLLGFDHFQYTVYNDIGSHYDFHTDTIFGENLPPSMSMTRKLSFSVLLSDPNEYEGGDFEILVSGEEPVKIEQKKGRVIAFPSFMLHRVTPVTSGCRKSIVFWAVGPKFK